VKERYPQVLEYDSAAAATVGQVLGDKHLIKEIRCLQRQQDGILSSLEELVRLQRLSVEKSEYAPSDSHSHDHIRRAMLHTTQLANRSAELPSRAESPIAIPDDDADVVVDVGDAGTGDADDDDVVADVAPSSSSSPHSSSSSLPFFSSSTTRPRKVHNIPILNTEVKEHTQQKEQEKAKNKEKDLEEEEKEQTDEYDFPDKENILPNTRKTKYTSSAGKSQSGKKKKF